MTKAVILTNAAESDLEQIISYLHENWGSSVCGRFLIRFENVCEFLSKSPELYPLTNKKENIRKCILTRQNSLYYREQPDYIEVIRIFDTRQDPEKLRELIEEE